MNKRVRFTLEVVYQNDGLTNEVIKDSWKRFSDYEEMLENKESWENTEYSKRLLETLLSDELLLSKYLKFLVMSEIEQLDFRSLQKIFNTPDQDELTVLQEATQKLNYVDRAWFGQVIDDGVLSENTYELSDSFKIVSKKIEIDQVLSDKE